MSFMPLGQQGGHHESGGAVAEEDDAVVGDDDDDVTPRLEREGAEWTSGPPLEPPAAVSTKTARTPTRGGGGGGGVGLAAFKQNALGSNVVNTPVQTTATGGSLAADSPDLPSDSQFAPVVTPSGGGNPSLAYQQHQLQQILWQQQQQQQRQQWQQPMQQPPGAWGGMQPFVDPTQQLAYAQAQYAFAMQSAAQMSGFGGAPAYGLPQQQQQQQFPTPSWGASATASGGAGELGGSSEAMPISPQRTEAPPAAAAEGGGQSMYYWDRSSAAETSSSSATEGEAPADQQQQQQQQQPSQQQLPPATSTGGADSAALQKEIEWCREEIARSRNMYQEDIAGIRAELAAKDEVIDSLGAGTQQSQAQQQQHQQSQSQQSRWSEPQAEAEFVAPASASLGSSLGGAVVDDSSSRWERNPQVGAGAMGEGGVSNEVAEMHSSSARFTSDPNAGGEYVPYTLLSTLFILRYHL